MYIIDIFVIPTCRVLLTARLEYDLDNVLLDS